MARDLQPIGKQSRREGYALAPKASKIMAKKTGIPGQHADMRVRGGSLYLTQLREKQKVRRILTGGMAGKRGGGQTGRRLKALKNKDGVSFD